MAVNNGMLPGTSIISFEQLCVESDPSFYRGRDHPWSYEFANGRKFAQDQPWVNAPIVPVTPSPFALVFAGQALLFANNEQIEYQQNLTYANSIDALAPPPDETVTVFADALGFNGQPLVFKTQQVQFGRP